MPPWSNGRGLGPVLVASLEVLGASGAARQCLRGGGSHLPAQPLRIGQAGDAPPDGSFALGAAQHGKSGAPRA